MSKNFENLKDRATWLAKQLTRISEVRRRIASDDFPNDVRAISSQHSEAVLVPRELFGDWDNLIDRIEAHYKDRHIDVTNRMEAVDTLLAGFETKDGRP